MHTIRVYVRSSLPAATSYSLLLATRYSLLATRYSLLATRYCVLLLLLGVQVFVLSGAPPLAQVRGGGAVGDGSFDGVLNGVEDLVVSKY